MPTRITVDLPSPGEEARRLAEAMADLHYILGIIVENAKELIPGEAVEELTAAWEKSQPQMQALISNTAEGGTFIAEDNLGGKPGEAKRSTLRRLRDAFFSFWYSEPRTDEKRAKAAEAASDYLELGANVVSSIPGHEQVVELISLTKQLIGLRARRGY